LEADISREAGATLNIDDALMEEQLKQRLEILQAGMDRGAAPKILKLI
jgi:hypothetical protein